MGPSRGTCQAVCAGIVTYNPDTRRLAENLDAIAGQVGQVLIFDNGSHNQDAVVRLGQAYQDMRTISHHCNTGIAHALNCLAAEGSRLGYDRMVFLDQDSVAAPGMIEILDRYSGPSTGLVSPQIIDRNKQGSTTPFPALDWQVVEMKEAARKGAITSGSLINLAAFEAVGGCDDFFFIDYVDYDLNKRLLLEGFRIIRTGETYLLHEVGRARPTPLWTPRRGQDGHWRLERFYSFGHSPERCYYKARNRILFSKKYRGTGSWTRFEGRVQILPQMVLTLIFETGRMRKLVAFTRGTLDGERTEVPRYVPKQLATFPPPPADVAR